MSQYNAALNDLVSQGFDKEEAIAILDKRALSKIFLDEDEEYVNQEEITEENDEDEDEELDSIDDSVQDFEYDEDEEEELSFEENYTFTDEIDEEY
ncbi:hypothetical protein UFOVP53_176 [uncultured Caudovirales phage]|uniref:Uncharacterized protein n=1 Tax=uncultured Caudovirales phage TaxID=2100421 RepID=A0A6J5KZR4_9CAUD|nr:hypothetical protein UFOVP53_176 [uncultured Caudovirales phage]